MKTPESVIRACRIYRDKNRSEINLRARIKYRQNKQKIRDRRMTLKYGSSDSDYNRMLLDQGGTCAICCVPELLGGRWGKLNLDHDHLTGKIRGLLCFRCNLAIGKFEDRIDLLESAIKYLKKHS
jgi:hypothetical protein